tara:strand:+ start:72 stop:2036 length:1965 start_codon:yes stop_codon:yes gene_type:complete
MNILEIEDMIKGLPDQALQREAQMPSGQLPQFLVVSEIQRRSDMRKRFQERQPQGTVKDQVVQEGIAAMAPPEPQMQAAMMGMQQPMPTEQPVMGMFEGGAVRMAAGQDVPFLSFEGRKGEPTPITSEEYENNPERLAYVDERMRYLQALKDQGVTMEDILAQLNNMYYNTAGETSLRSVATTPTSEVLPPNKQGVGTVIENIPLTDIVRPGNRAFDALQQVFGEPQQPAPTPFTQEMYDQNIGGFRNVVDSTPKTMRGVRYPGLQVDEPIGRFVRERAQELVELSERQTNPPGTQASIIDASKLTPTQVDKDLVDAVTAPDAGGDTKDSPSGVSIDPKNVYGSVLSQMQTAGQDKLPELDLSAARTAAAGIGQAAQTLRSSQANYKDLVNTYTPDFMKFMPDYTSLVQDQETRAKKLREEARKEAGAQALIQLGAGIAGGDLAGGISRAGKTAAEIKKDARREASAEEQLARRMQMAQQEARMSLGIQSETAKTRAQERANDLMIKAYSDDRQRELTAAGMDAQAAQSLVSIETAAAQAKVAGTEKDRKFAIDRLTQMVAAQRYQDLQDQEQIRMDRQELALFEDVIKDQLEEYVMNKPEATPAEIANFARELMGTLGIGDGADTTVQEKPSGGTQQTQTATETSPDPLGLFN